MSTQAVEAELVELEKRYWHAVQDKDIETAMRLSDDPCFVTGAQGVGRIDRRTLGAMLTAAPYTLHRFDLKEVQVRLLTPDVAILAYKVHEELTVEGEPVALDAADSSAWVRRDGRWLCALHTEAIAGDPFGRDRQKPNPALK